MPDHPAVIVALAAAGLLWVALGLVAMVSVLMNPAFVESDQVSSFWARLSVRGARVAGMARATAPPTNTQAAAA